MWQGLSLVFPLSTQRGEFYPLSGPFNPLIAQAPFENHISLKISSVAPISCQQRNEMPLTQREFLNRKGGRSTKRMHKEKLAYKVENTYIKQY